MPTTKPNSVQLRLLQLCAYDLSKHELADIQTLLADYFIRKADEEMGRLQQQNSITQSDLDTLLDDHLRSSS